MKQKLELLVGRDDAASEPLQQCGESIRGEEIEIALLREKQRREKQQEAKA